MYVKEYSYRHWKSFRREPLSWTSSAASKRGIVVLYSSPPPLPYNAKKNIATSLCFKARLRAKPLHFLKVRVLELNYYRRNLEKVLFFFLPKGALVVFYKKAIINTSSLSLSSCSSTATLVWSWLTVLLFSCLSESSEPFSRRSLFSSCFAYLHSCNQGKNVSKLSKPTK